MFHEELPRVYPGTLHLFYTKQASNTVDSLNIKVCKVDITGWIINTFPRNKTVDQIFIFFGKWLKHDTSLTFRSTCAKQLSKNNNKPATCARTSSLCIIYKVNADPYSTWTFNTRCWTLIIILRTERQKLQVFLLTVFFFSINIVGVDTLINFMYLM